LQGVGERRVVIRVEQFEFHVLVIDDLQKKHPAQLRQALSIAVNTDVLAHDVLNGFNGCSDRHE
jgi:hypothetical protein